MSDEKTCHENESLIEVVKILVNETRFNHRILIIAIAVIGAGKEILTVLY
jgi:hypothetical protein